MIEIRLPFPPSVNSMFLNNRGRGKGRIPTPEYRAWKEQAAWELKAQRAIPIACRCVVDIDLDERRQGDADNRAKAVLDALVSNGILQDDSKKYVKRTSCGWEAVEGCRVRLYPVE